MKGDSCTNTLLFSSPELKNPQVVNDPFAIDRVNNAFARVAGFMDYIKAMDPGLVYDYRANADASLLLGRKNAEEVRRVYQLKDMGSRKGLGLKLPIN